MVRIGIAVVLAAGVGWLFLGRGGDASAVTDCISDAGASVVKSERYGQIFPYAIAARNLDSVQSYPELDGAEFYSVSYGADRALLFVGDGADDAAAFEATLAGLVSAEGRTMTARRSGDALLVWEKPTYAPDVDICFD